ncbi:MAG: methyltransferase domain-containing protein [Chloroflexi bacterium]|nr:methyltransferase domain-containing protein [Chloroflexota bacterium]
MQDDPKRLVEAGYDQLAGPYLAGKPPLAAATADWLMALLAGLPSTATVLDLGCGAGLPVTRWLAERAAVTGVDVSAAQLALAARHVPGARFLQADMTAVDVVSASVDAVVALWSIIHVPRGEQAALVGRIHDWLRPGGRFLATWAIHAWEGQEADWEGWGAPMWWSHHDEATNQALLGQAGFAIERSERRAGGGETWRWILARRPTETPRT